MGNPNVCGAPPAVPLTPRCTVTRGFGLRAQDACSAKIDITDTLAVPFSACIVCPRTSLTSNQSGAGSRQLLFAVPDARPSRCRSDGFREGSGGFHPPF